MDIGSAAFSSSRLLEAFERLGVSQGEGLVSSGPSPVPKELSQMFERLMEQEPHVTSFPGAGHKGMSGTEVSVPIPQEAVPGTGGAEASPEPHPLQAAPAQEAGTPAFPSPAELYHLQFRIAMLRMLPETGAQINQKTAQGIDSLLRNQS